MNSPFSPFIKQAFASAHVAVLVMGMAATSLAVAQNELSLEELEEKVAQQRIALEEAIANREATEAKVAEVEAELAESEERRQQATEELQALCEEQEALTPGSFDNCMSSSDS